MFFTKAQKYLKNKNPNTAEGKQIIKDAFVASYDYPNLSGPELIRLVYWGVTELSSIGSSSP
jgi:hypothetical protein